MILLYCTKPQRTNKICCKC